MLLVVVAWAWLYRPAPMPSYQGRSAAYWLDNLFTGKQVQAFEAFRVMGKEAFPFLLETLQCEDSAKAKLHTFVYRGSPKFVRSKLPSPDYGTRRSAAELILMNSQDVASAVPELLNIARRTTGRTRQAALQLSANRVTGINAKDAPVFAAALTDTNAATRYIALTGITRMEYWASNAAPAVAKVLNDPDDLVRVTAANCYWHLTSDTNTVIPILRAEMVKADSTYKTFSPYYRSMGAHGLRGAIVSFLLTMSPDSADVADYYHKQLNSADAAVRRNACKELEGLGGRVRLLTPNIFRLFSDPDEGVKKAAGSALRKIDPVNYKFVL